MQTINISQIVADPQQPRQVFDAKSLELLQKSIASQGILRPLVLEKMRNGKFLIVDGERRYRAAIALGLTSVPADIMEPMDIVKRLVTRFHIQDQHKSWSMFDKARAVRDVVSNGKMEADEVADLLGLDVRRVWDMLNLLEFSNERQAALEEKKVPMDIIIGVVACSKDIRNNVVKDKLQDILINKYFSGDIKNKTELKYVAAAIKKGGLKTVGRIIKDKNFDFDKILKTTGEDVAVSYRKVSGAVSVAIAYLKESVRKGSYRLDKGNFKKNLKVLSELASEVHNRI